jgi:hypothetical protein
LDVSALLIFDKATVWVSNFMLTEWIVSGRQTAEAEATVKTPGFIAKPVIIQMT